MEQSPAPVNGGEPPSDRSLLHRFQSGNEEAATALYERYADRLRRLAAARCPASLARRVDADDIVQSVFRAFFHGARDGCYDVPQGEDLWKLLLVMALNKIRAQGAFHQAAKRDIRVTSGGDHLEEDAVGRLQDDQAQPLLRMVVDEALDQLDERQREIVRLRLHGHEVAEIAELIGRSKRTVERNLQDARTKLSDLLGQDI